jgi:AraC-like DNA-binding protein
VSVTLTSEWLEGNGLDQGRGLDAVRRFQSQHLARCDWQPSARALGLAGQIVHAPGLQPFLHRLYLESRTVELVSEALSALCQTASPPPCGLTARDRRRLQDLRERIDDGSLPVPDMASVAREVGMSVASLQRKFRLLAGMPLFAYVRQVRLAAAKQAIEQDGLSIAGAADLAGYTSAANFATAFRRQFGVSPGHFKSSCR